jgi:hypothetical protein
MALGNLARFALVSFITNVKDRQKAKIKARSSKEAVSRAAFLLFISISYHAANDSFFSTFVTSLCLQIPSLSIQHEKANKKTNRMA